MPTHVALLRGINVGGHNKLAMADLRDLAASAGFADAQTYIQSGNLVFRADGAADEAALASSLAGAISSALAMTVPVVVIGRERLERIAASNPFPEETDPRKVHVAFSQVPPGPEQAAAVAALQAKARERGSDDRAVVVDGVALYLHTPGGLGRSDLAALLSRATSPTADATLRNVATVGKLRELLSA